MSNTIINSTDELASLSNQVATCFNWRLGDILVVDGAISSDQLTLALQHQQKHAYRLGTVLLNLGYATEDQIHLALMKKSGIPKVNLKNFTLSDAMQSLIPYDISVRYCVVPLAIINDRLYLAMADPLNWRIVNQISGKTGMAIEPVLSDATEIKETISLHQRASVMTIEKKGIQVTDAQSLISDEWVLKYKIMPLVVIENRLFLAMADPNSRDVIEQVGKHTGFSVHAVLASPREIEKMALVRQQKDAERKAEQSTVRVPKDQWAPQRKKSQGNFAAKKVIKERFVLESILGEGGMGTVYKATDLLRQEANDKNCYVALKVLSETFKDNPAAFVTMQQEASKTQQLNHPNIVTVNDFDRDGATIYIIMEYLEGQALSDMLANQYPKGMPVSLVLNILKDLSSALDFAHQNHIIHCDFKPGNAFVTKDNVVKVIDFGIARSRSKAGSSEKSGAVLGFTPSYASTELFYGAEPSPSDDVYALACATYKMLTGQHPFLGHSTLEADRMGLRPRRIHALSRRQWQGLLRGLAFARPDRTPSTRLFLQDLEPLKVHYSTAAIVVLMGLLFAAFYFLALPVLEERKVHALIAKIERKEISDIDLINAYFSQHFTPDLMERVSRSINQRLINDLRSTKDEEVVDNMNVVRQLPKADQKFIFSSRQVRKRLIVYYHNQIEKLINLTQKKYYFSRAEKLLGEGKLLYPDSISLLNIERDLVGKKSTLLVALEANYQTLLAANALLPSQQSEGLPGILTVMRQVQPDHKMLRGKECVTLYLQGIAVAINAQQYTLARQLLQTSALFWPNNIELKEYGQALAQKTTVF